VTLVKPASRTKAYFDSSRLPASEAELVELDANCEKIVIALDWAVDVDLQRIADHVRFEPSYYGTHKEVYVAPTFSISADAPIVRGQIDRSRHLPATEIATLMWGYMRRRAFRATGSIGIATVGREWRHERGGVKFEPNREPSQEDFDKLLADIAELDQPDSIEPLGGVYCDGEPSNQITLDTWWLGVF
jgi:hypothetical protein